MTIVVFWENVMRKIVLAALAVLAAGGNALARPVWFLPDTLCVQARIVIPYLQQLAGRGRLRKSFQLRASQTYGGLRIRTLVRRSMSAMAMFRQLPEPVEQDCADRHDDEQPNQA